MPKFNGQVTLVQFKKAAVQIKVFDGTEDDAEWQKALERVRTWKAAARVLPSRHPMLPIAMGEEI